jgi:hypothetical protein
MLPNLNEFGMFLSALAVIGGKERNDIPSAQGVRNHIDLIDSSHTAFIKGQFSTLGEVGDKEYPLSDSTGIEVAHIF